MLDHRRLDLAQFNTIASHLDLVIETSEEIDVSVGQVPHQVARAIESRAGHGAVRMRDKAFRGRRRIVQVTSAHARASHAQLSGDTLRNEIQTIVQNQQLSVIVGLSDRRCNGPLEIIQSKG